MNALNRVRELAHAEPAQLHSDVFRELLDSLEAGGCVCLTKLYDLDYSEFELAINAMKDWRLHRFGYAQTFQKNN